MDRPSLKSKPRRKLSRTQIIDILERNVSLYKDEQSFVHYLVELAVYLLEFEYDWAEGGAEPPPVVKRLIEKEPAGEAPANGASNNGVTKAVSARLTQASAPLKEHKSCPFCGTYVGELLVCPTCRSLTR